MSRRLKRMCRQMVLAIFMREDEQALPHLIGVWNFMEHDVLISGGRFYLDFAKVKDRRKEPANLGRHILKLKQVQFSNDPGKNTLLLDIDNSVVRHDP